MKVEEGIGVYVLVAEAVGGRLSVVEVVAVDVLTSPASTVFVETGGGAITSIAVGGRFAIKVAETSVSTEGGIPFVITAVGEARDEELHADKSSNRIRTELETITRW